MGKASALAITLLMINIVGFLLMDAAVQEGYAAGNPYITQNSLLTTLYSAKTDISAGANQTIYELNNESALAQGVPSTLPQTYIQNLGQFIDRIFVIFGFFRTLIGIAFFPAALVSYLGLPWQLSMLLFPPIALLYLMGLIDILSGGDS